MYLIFDTETTGLPKNWNAPITDTDNWPRCVQLAWQIHDGEGRLIEHSDYLIRPEGYEIPFESEKVHGISTALAEAQGLPLEEVLQAFETALGQAKFVVGHNLNFDLKVMGCEQVRAGFESRLLNLTVLDTCTEETAKLCRIPGGRGGKFKLPTLTELHEFLFQSPFEEAHNATADVEATTRCFLELIRRQEFSAGQLGVTKAYFDDFRKAQPDAIQAVGLEHVNLKEASLAYRPEEREVPTRTHVELGEEWEQASFAHLHNHSQYSVLQSTMSPNDLVDAAAEFGCPAVAITDHGNLMGAFKFVSAVQARNAKLREAHAETGASGEPPQIKPIIGVEFQVCKDHKDRSHKDNGYRIVVLARNKQGYLNLAKLSSLSFTEGFYYIPRIDRELLETYKADLIVLSGGMEGEIPSKILNFGENQAEEALLWWKETFGPDFYLEIMRHGQEDEDRVNEVLIRLADKHEVPLVATNNTYYRKKQDAEAHDILLCVKEGEKKETPIGRGRGFRYGLPNDEYYFKSPAEMKELFRDLPECIFNIQEIVDKVEPYELARDVLLPIFEIPEEFRDPEDEKDGGHRGENAYLKHITYLGAEKRYGTLTTEIRERIDFELETIANSGYPGYFLIVEDLIREARKMGVSVGPGRGSAAGSVVAYCLEITNIDPIHYDLLFERFLNPDRVSLPDIDIDFDDEGRGKVLDYVIDKYGSNQVAQIITYGTMAGKSSIRDTARVMDLPLPDADRLAKYLPDMTKLNEVLDMEEADIRKKFRSEQIDGIMQLRALKDSDSEEGKIVRMARVMEGSVRSTGIHACGVIITPDDMTKFVPIANSKESHLNATQFDNSVVESAGLLKMDFLGLKTLSLIKDTVKIVKARSGVELDPENFPLDDAKTYELFQRGETIGIFQYESKGMQKYLKELKPTVFDDLIAMNALYRPGPLEYIPSFIARKHGLEEITYDLPAMEEYLQVTYGITVYQEQVMRLSQKLAGFSKGDADVLRKAMGKKKFDLIEKLRPQFIEGGVKNGHPREVLEKIYKDWEAFASYAFNKSHSTCYAFIAYQTAYLKAHYPAEYMAAVLSNNMNHLETVTFFMEECRRMGLAVLGPDVNESFFKFGVNKDNAIRFGLGAIRGVGRGAVETIVEERKAQGPFESVFDLAKRIDLRAANKRAFENMALAGAFDSLGNHHRAQYFFSDANGIPFLDKAVRFGQKYQEGKNSMQVNIFGEAEESFLQTPEFPECEEWGTMEKLRKEKEVVGLYLSGHPLDDFKMEIEYFCNVNLHKLNTDLQGLVGKEVNVAGILTSVEHRVSRQGKGFGIFTLEDYEDSYKFRIFGEDYLKYQHFLAPNTFLFLRLQIQSGWEDKRTGELRDPRIHYADFRQLQDVMEHYARKITLHMPLKSLQEQRIRTLLEAINKFKGEKGLFVSIYEPEEDIQVDLGSRSCQVRIDRDFLEWLEEQSLHYKLN